LATVHSFGVEYWSHASGEGDLGALWYRTEKSGQQFFLPLTPHNLDIHATWSTDDD